MVTPNRRFFDIPFGSATELYKLHAIGSLIVMATLQECALSNYEFVYLAWSHELKMAVVW